MAVHLHVRGHNWVESATLLQASDGTLEPRVIRIAPHALLIGRVLAVDDLSPVAAYAAYLDSHLDREGQRTYRAQAQHVKDEKGQFCLTPSQFSFANRIRIEAEGYQTLETPWLDVVPGVPLDVGSLYLEPAPRSPMAVQVLDTKGEPVIGAQVLCVTTPLSLEDLRLFRGRLGLTLPILGHDEVLPGLTGPDGHCGLMAPAGKTTWVAAWAPGLSASIVEARMPVQDAGPISVVLVLQPGSSLTLRVLLDEVIANSLSSLELELLGSGPGFSVLLDLEGWEDGLDTVVSGLEAGNAEVRLIGRGPGPHGGETQALIAREALVLDPGDENYMLLDCSPHTAEFRLEGRVSIPDGILWHSLRAFHTTSEESPLPTRTAPVSDGYFALALPIPTGIVGVYGTDASSSVHALWVQRLELPTNDRPVAVDLARRVVYGNVGELKQVPVEEVVVQPAPDHPLYGVEAARIDIVLYPEGTGEFTLYGLPPGPWIARGQYTGRSSRFTVEAQGTVVTVLDR